MDPVFAAAVGLGALGVFALMVPESAGIPIPSEVVLVLAGVAVADGHMHLWAAVVAGTAGNLVGSLIFYELGRRLRQRAHGPRARHALARSERLFDRHGQRAVFFGRLIPLVRSFISLPAGAARIPLLPFAVMTVAGCAIWSVLFIAIGVVAGTSAANLGASAGPYVAAAMLLTLTVLGVRRARAPSRAG